MKSLRFLSLAIAFAAAAEAGAAAPAPEKPAKPPRLEQNGIARPKADTLIGKLWGISDSMSARLARPVTRGELKEQLKTDMPDLNEATFATQYARWVKFHGAGEALKAYRELNKQPKAPSEDKAAAKKAAATKKAADAAAEKQAKQVERDKKAAEAKAAKEAKAKAKADAAAAKTASGTAGAAEGTAAA